MRIRSQRKKLFIAVQKRNSVAFRKWRHKSFGGNEYGIQL